MPFLNQDSSESVTALRDAPKMDRYAKIMKPIMQKSDSAFSNFSKLKDMSLPPIVAYKSSYKQPSPAQPSPKRSYSTTSIRALLKEKLKLYDKMRAKTRLNSPKVIRMSREELPRLVKTSLTG
jgi:hypothetical protein